MWWHKENKMIEKLSVIDQIKPTRYGNIQVRRADLIFKDGVEVSKIYHRHCLDPGADLTGQDERVAAVAKAVWTPKVIKEHKNRMKERKL